MRKLFYSAAVASAMALASCSPNAETLYQMAQNAYEAGDDAKAMEYYQQASDLGHPDAMTMIAINYMDGEYGYTKDSKKALELFEKASAIGSSDASYFAGLYYIDDEDGIPQNKDLAYKYMSDAASKGCKDAYYFMGNCYLNGIGVPVDSTKSLEWYMKSAEDGDAYAQFAVGKYYDFRYDIPNTIKWYKMAADQEYPLAMYYYALCCIHEEDYETAGEYMRKSADMGCESAIEFMKEHGGPQN
ncbi:MAG: sel1 repeat family protein [Bacteroidales bacterium]|nr:sel1 repeat family protein [Bacteroidales bacterium]